MADLFAMKAPLQIRLADGSKHIMAEYFPHPRGLLYFDLYWNSMPTRHAVHLVEGEYKGDGPWKVGDAVITVVGCHGTDACLATALSEWRSYLQMQGDAYPTDEIIRNIAREYGASV